MSQSELDQDNVLGEDVEESAFARSGGGRGGRESVVEAPARKFGIVKILALCGGAIVALFLILIVIGKMRGGNPEDVSVAQVSSSSSAQMAPPVGQQASPAPQALPVAPEQSPAVSDVALSGTTVPAEMLPAHAAIPAVESAPTPEATGAVQAPATSAQQAAPAPAIAQVVVPSPATQQPIAKQPATAAPNSATAQAKPAAAYDVQGRLEALSDDVWRLQQEVKRLRGQPPRPVAASPKRAPSSRTPAAPSKVEGVTLKAVVDQNAWIQIASGESVMVAPGDTLPGGGTIKSVDPDSGTVQLSDGRVIR